MSSSRIPQPTTKTTPQTEQGNIIELIPDHSSVDNIKEHSSTVVKGRLRESLTFWESIGSSNWVIKVIRDGYYLPFVGQPAPKFFNNHASCRKHSEFVTSEVHKLLSTHALIEVPESQVTVCSPLGVVENSAGKLRLILDLRYVNKHLRVVKFKYEDIRTACDLFSKDDWFFKFDYKSGYHHIEIFPDHRAFLGCSWKIDGQLKYFKFTVLPFGLATAPFLFTKIQRALVKHWRRKGLRIFTCLDDGAGAEATFVDAKRTSDSVRQDIRACGFVANEEKSQWEPVQQGELLGFIVDFHSGVFRVPERRIVAFEGILQRIVNNSFMASARTLA